MQSLKSPVFLRTKTIGEAYSEVLERIICFSNNKSNNVRKPVFSSYANRLGAKWKALDSFTELIEVQHQSQDFSNVPV